VSSLATKGHKGQGRQKVSTSGSNDDGTETEGGTLGSRFGASRSCWASKGRLYCVRYPNCWGDRRTAPHISGECNVRR
jgi:hypothetical protein